MLLDGKVVVVTGAGRGIGRAVALDLARNGARVVVNDYGVAVDGTQPSRGPAEDVVQEIKAMGGEAVPVFETVTTVEGGERIVRTALDAFGKLDGLVTVAGILRERMLFNMSEAEWDAVIETHLKGHYTTWRPAAIIFRQQRSGRFVGFTSTAGIEGSAGQPNYAAAKEGIIGLMRSTALAMGRYNVTANVISPGAATRMTERSAGTPAAAGVVRSAEPDEPEHVAPAVSFLISDAAAQITGQVVSARGWRVGIYSQPRLIRTAYKEGGWTAEELARQWESVLGQDELDRFNRPSVQRPGQAPAAGS